MGMTTLLTVMQFIVNILIIMVLLSILIVGLYLLFKDKRQEQHSVLRNFPVLGRIRYFSEKIGPELRQYLFANDTEGKPFSRNQYTDIVLASKYHSRMTSFGTEKTMKKVFIFETLCFHYKSQNFKLITIQ